MKVFEGLSRQIIFSMSAVVLCVIALVMIGSYIFYSLIWTLWQPSMAELDEWLPTTVEWAWMALITIVSLAVGALAATKLSRRILIPLNSVAYNLRKLADGDLDARAVTGDQSLGEAASLVNDFNSMAGRLKRMAKEQAFWNAAIAHELRTPLTILRGRLQGLTEGVFEPNKSQLSSLLGQVEDLTQLIEDLRVIGLADSGYLKVHLEEADLATEIERAVHLFEPILQAGGFVLQLDLQRRPVRCDPIRIRQVLLALLDNVRQHATPGDVVVHFSSRNEVNYLRVRDNGPGINKEFATHIFEAFQRGENSRSRAQGGSGLGLAVVRAIALAHGGTVYCRTMANRGTLFEFSWPARSNPE